MSNLLNSVSKKYLPIKSKVAKEYFEENKANLSEEEFRKRFLCKEYGEGFEPDYYEYTNAFEDNTEFMMYMLHQLVIQQKTATKKLRIISGIVIFWLICDLAAAIILLVTLL